MKNLLQGILDARDNYESSLTSVADRASRDFKEAADFLNDNEIYGEYLVTKDITLGDGETSVPASWGICWAGGKFGYYFSESVDPDTPLHSFPNVLGETREIRVEAVKLLPKLLNDIAADFGSRAEHLYTKRMDQVY